MQVLSAKAPGLRSALDLKAALLENDFSQVSHPMTFHYLRQWYRWCAGQRIPGFSQEVTQRLYLIKLKRRGARGTAVMTRDPRKGPLDDYEHWLVRQAVKEGKGSLLARVCIMLLLELGARPIQLQMLEEQDFHVMDGAAGQRFYSLDVPRAKQRTGRTLEKKRRKISPDAGQAIAQLIESNHRRYGDRGPGMPILCSHRNQKTKKLTAPLKSRYLLHMKASAFRGIVKKYARQAALHTPRTDGALHLAAIRFRYTLGTRLAEQGTPAVIIAELLDHSTLECVQVYTKSTSNLVDQLNTALGHSEVYTETIDRFLGRLEPRPERAQLKEIIPGITPTRKNLGGLGICGANFLCHLFPPLSCYSCPKFIAWINGPHAQMLQELETFVQQLIECTGNPSDRIPHQLREVMSALRAVIARIDELKAREVRS
jgi:integrase